MREPNTTIVLELDGDRWEWSLHSPNVAEAAAIEELFGDVYPNFIKALTATSMRAILVLIYVLKKRENKDLRFSEFTFEFGDLSITTQAAPEEPAADPTPEESVLPLPVGSAPSSATTESPLSDSGI